MTRIEWCYYRLLGCITARTEEEFLYFYSLNNKACSKSAVRQGRGIWNGMYKEPSEKAKESHRAWVRNYQRKKKLEKQQ